MGLLVTHLAKTDKPYWEVLTWKEHWWQRRNTDVRIVFPFYINGDDKMYRLDYNDKDDDIIFVHKKPRKLLEQYGIDYHDDCYAQELRELKDYLIVTHADEIGELRKKRPKIPPKLSYLYDLKKLFSR